MADGTCSSKFWILLFLPVVGIALQVPNDPGFGGGVRLFDRSANNYLEGLYTHLARERQPIVKAYHLRAARAFYQVSA